MEMRLPAVVLRDECDRALRHIEPDLRRRARRLLRDRAEADDLVQEVLMRAWRNWAALRESASRRAWVMAILRNEHARRIAARRAAHALSTDFDVSDTAAPVASPTFFEIENLLAALPLAYRVPLILRALGGFTCAEIAASLGISSGAVMTRLARARLAMRREFPIGERISME